MANTRPYTREELKGLRRANLQNLFKIHNLKGANGTNTILIDSLVEYFASPQYLSAHPPHIIEKEKDKAIALPVPPRPHTVNVGKIENRYKNVPVSRPVKGRVVSSSGVSRKPAERDTVIAKQKKGAAAVPEKPSEAGPSGSVDVEPFESAIITPQALDQPHRSEVIIPPTDRPPTSLPTPPTSSSSQSHPVSFSQVETLLSANDARWQAKLEALEKNLNDQMERLRIEMNQIRNQHQAGPSSGTWSPWQNRSVSQPPTIPILGKRRQHPLSSTIDGLESEEDEHERNEAKRVRFNGSKPGDDTPLNEYLPSIIPSSSTVPPPPRTPSPQKTSAFGADYFANPSLTPLPAHSQSSLIPRTPSPSRQGTIPDNSQTPRLPNDWEGQNTQSQSDSELSDLEDEGQRTPISRGMIPQFSTTPEPPSHRPISPTMERSISGSSDRFTPGRIIPSTSTPLSHPPPPAFTVDPTGSRLAEVTDLERIDEMDESSNPHSHKLISPGGQLNFPTIRPIPRLSGLGTPGKLPVPSLQHQREPSASHQRKTSTSSTSSLLAPPLLISRNSRAESELPRMRVGSRGLSPPPRPRSANAIHGKKTPPRSMFPLNLPEPEEGYVLGGKIRSASADYMHVAMHGLQGADRGQGDDGLDFDDSVGEEKERERMVEMPTPSHRTLLGTERYNDRRFGDIPVSFGIVESGNVEHGIWESPR